MSLSVPGVSASPLDRRTAPPTPFADLLDLSDNPDTPGTTYSFQEPKQHQTMQTEQNYLVEPILDRPLRFHTDDEMVDSDIDRKDDDFDIEIDAYSNAGGVDLEDVNITMEEDYTDTVPETYDNDDLMIDEEEDILFQPRQQSPIPPTSTSTSLDNNETGPDPSQDTIRPQSAQTVAGDLPLFSFNLPHDSTNAHNTSFAAPENSSLPDHSLYEDVPTENAAFAEEATIVAIPSSAADVVAPAKPEDSGSSHPQSPAKAIEEDHATSGNLLEDVSANDITELDNDFQHHGSWSENTSTTLAHEPTLLEDQQTFENEESDINNHIGEAETEVGRQTPIDFAATEFASYTLHPIVVQWEKNRLSLFPPPTPIAEDGSMGSPLNDLEFLIQDHEVCDKGIDQLFQEFRSVLDGAVSKDVEFVIEIEGYGLEIGEDSKSCSSFSLQDIVNFHVHLHRHDGVENPEPLQLNLFTRPSLSNRVASLIAAVNQGIGFTQAISITEFSTEDSYTKVGDEQNESELQTESMPFGQQNNNNNDGGELLEHPTVESRHTQNSDSATTTPHALEVNDKEILKEIETKNEYSVGEKELKEDIEDDDDFDLEYGNEGNDEVGQDVVEVDDGLKADDNKSLRGSPQDSETPKPIAESADENPKGTEASVQIGGMSEVVIEEISDEVSQHDAQQPEDIEDSASEASRRASENEDEELIEYEEDDETGQQSVTADLPTINEPQSAKSRESSHHSPADQEVSHASGSPHDDEIQKLESPARSNSSEFDRGEEDHENAGQAKYLSGTHQDSANENEDVSTGPKIPSSIPVFHGDDSPEGEYEYVEDQQQQEYDGYGYDDQGQNFELEEREYDEERAEVAYENDHSDNLQDSEYPQEQFEYNADYPTDGQNEYLDEDGNQLQGDADGYENYVGDDAYNEFHGEQEYPTEAENGYPIEYPQGVYDDDSTTYQHEELGDVDDVETARAADFNVPIKGDQGNPRPSSDVVDILKKSSPIRQVEEEEQLIDYEDDEVELRQKSPAELQKSPGDQKRMREDELEKDEYESSGENQAAKRIRSE